MPVRIPLPFGPDAHTLDVNKSDPSKSVAHPEGAPNPKGVEVAQGFNGSFSHNDTVSGGVFHYAVDFLLPFDQPVLSQGYGKVIALDESHPDGGSYSTDLSDSSMGPSGIGNFVTVKYDEGFYATYQHLKQDGVEVIQDATVKPHDVLGHVGNTGYRTATHLHVTYGEQSIDWQAGKIADGSSAKNHNTAPVIFAADSDGILDEDKYYYGDNIDDIALSPTSRVDQQLTPDNIGETPLGQPPAITGYDTFQEGDLIFLRLHYTDPDGDAEGFGFRGVKGSGWAEETHPFSDPSYGRVSPGTIAYPFNHLATSDSPLESDVETWIYDKEGLRSDPVTVHLKAESQDQKQVSEVADPIPTDEVPFFILGGSNSELDPIGGTAM